MCHLWWNFLSEEWNLSCYPLHWLHSTGSHCVLFGPHRCWPSEMSLKSRSQDIYRSHETFRDTGQGFLRRFKCFQQMFAAPSTHLGLPLTSEVLFLGSFLFLQSSPFQLVNRGSSTRSISRFPASDQGGSSLELQSDRRGWARFVKGCAKESPGETGWRRKWLQWRRSNPRLPPPPWTCTTWGGRNARGVRRGSTT